MVNVSKESLGGAYRDELFRQLAATLADANTSKERSLLSALLTDAEQIMFAKRAAAVYMLRQGFPRQFIADTLSVSRTTVHALKKDYEKGRFEALGGAKKRMSVAEKEEVWRKIGYIVRLGMPPMAGDERKYWMNRHFGKPVPKRK